MKKKKVLVICPSPKGTAPTQRMKYEQYLDLLEQAGYIFTISPFQTQRFWDIVYKPGRMLEKVFWTGFGYLRRIFDLIRAPFYDGIFVNLWVTPFGVPIFEHLLFFFNKNVIYDIDDMIFLDNVHVKKKFFHRFKGRKKPIVLMQQSKYVITCTPKLEEIAKGMNRFKKAIDISSTLDTDRFIPVPEYKKNEITTIGWTGTYSTLSLLEDLQPVLARVASERKIKLLVIANRQYAMKEVDTEYIHWKKETEVEDLHRFEIGLYPVPANEWSLGKSSLKALTYMSVGVPVVATAYGVNFRVIEHGVSGLLAKDEEEWVSMLIQLIDDVNLRRQIGVAGRKRVEDFFSVKANFPKYLQVFKTVIPK